MTAFELVELLIAFENRLDVQWGVFITVHLALFGGIIYIDRPLRRMEKLAAILIYIGFAAINYLVSVDLANNVFAAQSEIAKLANHTCCDQNLLVQRIQESNSGPAATITHAVLLGSHLVMLVLVLLSVFYDKSVKR